MKKILITLLAIIACTLTINAQSVKYEKSVEVGCAIGVGKYPNNTFTASMINGVRINRYLYTGIGVGIGYSNAIRRHSTDIKRVFGQRIVKTELSRRTSLPIPVFLSIKASMPTDSNVSPFIRLDAGYTLDINKYLKNAPGLMIEPSIGIDYNLSAKTKMYVIAGFNLQKNKFDIDTTDEINFKSTLEDYTKPLHAVSVRAGITF